MKPMTKWIRILCVLGVALAVADFANRAWAVGAVTPFTSVEVESGKLGGGAMVRTLITPNNSDSSPELEASGHAFVQLNATSQSVTLTNNTVQNVTALNLRYSIADAPTGGGANATHRTFFTMKPTSSSPALQSSPEAQSRSNRIRQTPRRSTGWMWLTWKILPDR